MRMDGSLKKIGLELQRHFHTVVRRRLDWRIIDAIERLEEREEAVTPAESGEQNDENPEQENKR